MEKDTGLDDHGCHIPVIPNELLNQEYGTDSEDESDYFSLEEEEEVTGVSSNIISLKGKAGLPADYLPTKSKKTVAGEVKEMDSLVKEQQKRKQYGQESREEKKEPKTTQLLIPMDKEMQLNNRLVELVEEIDAAGGYIDYETIGKLIIDVSALIAERKRSQGIPPLAGDPVVIPSCQATQLIALKSESNTTPAIPAIRNELLYPTHLSSALEPHRHVPCTQIWGLLDCHLRLALLGTGLTFLCAFFEPLASGRGVIAFVIIGVLSFVGAITLATLFPPSVVSCIECFFWVVHFAMRVVALFVDYHWPVEVSIAVVCISVVCSVFRVYWALHRPM